MNPMQGLLILVALFLFIKLIEAIAAWIVAHIALIGWSLLGGGLVLILVSIWTREAGKEKAEKGRESPNTTNQAPIKGYQSDIYDPQNYRGMSTSKAWDKFRKMEEEEFRRTGLSRRRPPTGWQPGEVVDITKAKTMVTISSNVSTQEIARYQSPKLIAPKEAVRDSDLEAIDTLLNKARKSLSAVDALVLSDVQPRGERRRGIEPAIQLPLKQP